MLSKKTSIIFLAIIIVLAGTAIILQTNPQLFRGKLTFFQEAPTAADLVNSSTITYYNALNMLLDAAYNAKRISIDERQNFLRSYANISRNVKITRAQFAKLASDIFKLKPYGSGAALNDIDKDTLYFTEIYSFTANGGVNMQFKPDNPATQTFAEDAVLNLTDRIR